MAPKPKYASTQLERREELEAWQEVQRLNRHVAKAHQAEKVQMWDAIHVIESICAHRLAVLANVAAPVGD